MSNTIRIRGDLYISDVHPATKLLDKIETITLGNKAWKNGWNELIYFTPVAEDTPFSRIHSDATVWAEVNDTMPWEWGWNDADKTITEVTQLFADHEIPLQGKLYYLDDNDYRRYTFHDGTVDIEPGYVTFPDGETLE